MRYDDYYYRRGPYGYGYPYYGNGYGGSYYNRPRRGRYDDYYYDNRRYYSEPRGYRRNYGPRMNATTMERPKSVQQRPQQMAKGDQQPMTGFNRYADGYLYCDNLAVKEVAERVN